MYESIKNCRSCGGPNLEEVLAFGDMPLADRLLTEEKLQQPEPKFPLTVVFCRDCSLVQIRETVEPEVLYGEEYPYYSSVSDGWVRHCRANALELIEMRNLNANSLVVELACNDGYLLKNFVEKGIPTLGIDPAEGPASLAAKAGIEVINDFFTAALADRLQGEGRLADVVIGNNVLAHVADLPGFVRGIAAILKPSGVAVIEMPYIRPLVEKCEFDTIYHEHHCYFGVTSLSKLFASQGLFLNDVRRLPTHGGSLRIFVEHQENPSDDVRTMLAEERELGVDRYEYYQPFAQRARDLQAGLLQMLKGLKQEGHRIAAYAAAAKGATMLNASGIGTDLLDFVVDRNEHKHGRFMPGVHVPIHDVSRLLSDKPDYTLLLAWNLKDEIVSQQEDYCRQGGRFIVPIPEPTII